MTTQAEHLSQVTRTTALEALRELLEEPIRRLVEWRTTLQSLTPGGSEFQSAEACEAYVRERLQAGREAKKEVARLRKAFRHTHVAGPDGDLDTCRKCGMDLRNPIHRREG